MAEMTDEPLFERLKLRRVINAAGTMTTIGSSRIVPEAVRAMSEVAMEFVRMEDLFDRSSDVIRRLTGAEAGFVTSSASSGLALAVAACMTGRDKGRIMRLPDSAGLRNEAVIQIGHMIDFGSSVEMCVRLPGARPVPVGSVSHTHDCQIESAVNDHTACIVHVVSHHTVRHGMVPLDRVVELAHARHIPVIVDAASEYDLAGFLKAGADIAIHSGHKFLGGPTSGIVAGRAELIAACRLQNLGIGRSMKVGKESVAGLIAALEAWEKRDHERVRQEEDERLRSLERRLGGLAGLSVEKVADPTGNPLDRLKVTVLPDKAGMTAAQLAKKLAHEPAPIFVRDDESELGFFFIDVCSMRDDEVGVVVDAIMRRIGMA